MVTIEDDVVDVLITELAAPRRQMRMSSGWDTGRRLALKQSVSFVLA